jgi:hypothetical protein
MIQFVANYEDLSTDRGYQFKFHCDKCGNGYMSEFVTSKTGTAADLLHTAGNLFGGLFGRMGEGAHAIQRAVGGKAHDEALRLAVEAGQKHFHQCTRCGKWVCPEVCWNEQAGLCEGCAPDAEEELAAQKAQATAEQIAVKTREQNYTKDIDFQSKTGLNLCPGCGAKNSPQAKFCSGCGQGLPKAAPAAFCPGCGFKLTQEKFCPQCGKKIG